MCKDIWNVDWGESTVSRTQGQLQYNRFKEGLEDVNDDASPGHPSTSTTNENIEAVKKIILNNRLGKMFGLAKATSAWHWENARAFIQFSVE